MDMMLMEIKKEHIKKRIQYIESMVLQIQNSGLQILTEVFKQQEMNHHHHQ